MRVRNKERRRVTDAQWRANNRERERARVAAYYAANPERRKAKNHRDRYGITEFDFNHLQDTQEFTCAICRQVEIDQLSPTRRAKVLNVDHNHQSGKVRGLLCRSCNQAIGLLRERPELCDAAKAYLIKHN